jgi:hypothetical protein
MFANIKKRLTARRKSRGVDPDSLNPDKDPDPAFQVNPDISLFDQKLQFPCVQAIEEAFSPQKRTPKIY